MQDYREELQNLHHRRVNYIVLGGSIMTLLFALLDFVTVPEFFLKFLNYRVVVAALGLLLFWVNIRDSKNRYAFWIGFLGYLSIIVIILLMIHQIGGVLSPYYVALIIAIALYATLAPLTVIQTLGAGILLVAGYILTVFYSHPATGPYTIELFSNLFFMTCFILIIATQSWAETAARKSEFELRKEEDHATSELSQQAEILESEVKKRSLEKNELDQKYRQLFNQIADHVVVLTSDGKIVQSNDRFNDRFFMGKVPRGKLLWDLVPQGDRPVLRQVMSNIIIGGEPLVDGNISLHGADGKMVDMEVNGNVVYRGDVPHGVLLIMRDLSFRKEIEKQVIRSLEEKKKTETSAILVLAKLSEFRDQPPSFHLERIREYCRTLTEGLTGSVGLKELRTSTFIEDIYHASILHDIGKVAIPDDYMATVGALDKSSADILNRHTLVGGDVIREMEEENEGSGFLTMAKHIAYFHHECWDGSGYPYGLSRREIPLAARIMAVADAYEELTTSFDSDDKDIHTAAINKITEGSGSRFDPQVVGSFLEVHSRFDSIRLKYPCG